MLLDSKNFGEKGRPPCAQVSRNAWEDIRRMTKKMAHNREKMRAKLNVLKFILVLYSRPLIKQSLNCNYEELLMARLQYEKIAKR